jgi:hypothetical protein
MKTKTDRIPRSLTDMADEIGFPGALILAALWGGGRLSIPAEIHRDHPIALVFEAAGAGYGAALSLAQLYGGQRIEIARLTTVDRLREMSIALRLQAHGSTRTEISRRLHRSTTHVCRLIADATSLGLTQPAADVDQEEYLAAHCRHVARKLATLADRLDHNEEQAA